MGKANRRLRNVVIILGLLVFLVMFLVNTPSLQKKAGEWIGDMLERKTGAHVEVGGLRWHLPTDVVLRNVCMNDLEGDTLLAVDRMAVKVEWMPLLRDRRLLVRNVRLFNPTLRLSADSVGGKSNYQFLLDAFSSDSERETSLPDICVNSIVIRNADIRYDVKNEAETPGQLNPNHLAVSDLCVQASLKKLTSDSLSLALRNMSFAEQSGLQLKDLRFRMVANREGADISDFVIKLPNTVLHSDLLQADYQIPAKGDTSNVFLNSLCVQGSVRDSKLVPSDLVAVLPALKGAKTPFLLDTQFKTDVRRIDIPSLALRTERKDVDIMLKGKCDIRDPKRPHLDGTLSRCNVTENGWNVINTLLSSFDMMTSSTSADKSLAGVGQKVGNALGNVSLKGDFDFSPQSASLDAVLLSDAGEMSVKGVADSKGDIDAVVETKEADMRRLTGLSDLGMLTAEAQVKAKADLLKGKLYTADFNAQIPQIQYKGYSYNPISAEGRFDNGRVIASLAMNDENGAVVGNVDWNPSAGKDNTACKIDMAVKDVNLHALHLIDSHENTRASFKLRGNVTWKEIENIAGTISVDSLIVADEKGPWQVRNITLRSMPDERRKIFTLRSDNTEGNVSGDFSFEDLPVALCRMVNRYEPTLVSVLFPPSLLRRAEKPADDANNLSLSIQMTDLQMFDKLLGIPLVAVSPVSVSGFLFEGSNNVNIDVEAPMVLLGEDRYRDVRVELSNEKGPLELTANGRKYTSVTSFLQAGGVVKMEDDGVALDLEWNTSDASLFSGSVDLDASFAKTPDNKLALSIKGNPSSMVLNNATWNLSPFRASIDNELYAISDFLVSSGDQYLSIDGTVDAKGGKNNPDSVSILLKDINIENLVSMAKLNGISFGGSATGTAHAKALFSKHPNVSADLSIRDLSFCNALLGDARAVVGYDENDILFRVSAVDTSKTNSNHLPYTVIHGNASVQNNSLDLTVDADSTNLAFVSGLLPDVMADVRGKASGSLRISGPFNALDMEGDMSTGGTSFLLAPTGVRYRFADVIRFRPGTLRFDNIQLRDIYDNRVDFDGIITHKKLQDWAYDLHIKDNGALGYYVPNSGQDLYYTTIFADGTVHVFGNETDGLHVDVDARTCKNSLFAINLGSQAEADGQFILFRDRDEVEALRQQRQQRESGMSQLQEILRSQRQRRSSRRQGESNFAIDINARITPDATLKLVMDASTDDHIRAFGSGDLDILFNNSDIALRGMYTISYGFYALSIQDIIHKNFEIVNGSTVTFDGDPLEARLDITAQHTLGSVSFRDLTSDASSMENVRVNCLLRIGGTPANPTLAFDLELPQGTAEQKALLRSYTATEEQMNLQFVYLLTLGRFYTYDYSQAIDGTQGGVVQSLLNSTLSGQINTLISSFIPTDEWTFSSTIRQDDRMGAIDDEDLLGNMEVQGMLEGRLLNNRLLVNGNFGYRDNPMYASNFIGDFDVRYLLVPGSNLWLKGYNKTNDRYFSRTALTQQGIGVLYSHDFDFIIPPRSSAAAPDSISIQTDSIP